MASTAKPKQTLDLSSLSSLTLASMFTGGGGLTLGAGGGGGRVAANVARLISAVGSETRERHQSGLADAAGTFMHQVSGKRAHAYLVFLHLRRAGWNAEKRKGKER